MTTYKIDGPDYISFSSQTNWEPWKGDVIAWWEFAKPRNNEGMVEIRFTDGNKPQEFYQKMRQFLNENNIVFSSLSQLFVSELHEVIKLFEFDGEYFRKNYKICYGLNERFANDGKIGGSYEYVTKSRVVFFDIDKEDKNIPDEYLHLAADKLTKYLVRYNLVHPLLVHSGGGIHVLYKIPEQIITEARKRWYKEFVKGVSAKLSNKHTTVDALYDFTRVFSIPGSMNVKRDKSVFVLPETKNISMNPDFKIGSKRESRRLTSEEKKKSIFKNLPDVTESLEWAILTNNPLPPEGDRHNTLIFAMKLLLKAVNASPKEVSECESILGEIYGGKIILKPTYGTKGKSYHPGIAINWCKRNKDWVMENKNVEKKLIQMMKHSAGGMLQ